MKTKLHQGTLSVRDILIIVKQNKMSNYVLWKNNYWVTNNLRPTTDNKREKTTENN